MKLWQITRSRGEFLPLQVLGVFIAGCFMDWSTINPWWGLVTLAVVILYNVCFVEAYLHRFCTHRSYELSKPVEYLMAILSTVVPGTGSTVGWATIHVAHHQHSDTPLDPHSPHHSSFMKLLMWKYPNTGNIVTARRLLADPVHSNLHFYYVVWMLAWAGLWYMLLGYTGLFFMVLLPWALAPVMSTIQNYGLHTDLPWAYRNYCTADHSQNSPILHWFSFGACGLHNNHHGRPGNWDTRSRKHEIDTAALFIKLIKKGTGDEG